MSNTFKHREAWLHALTDEFRPMFDSIGHAIPRNLRLTCGFPSRRGIALKRRALGQAWASTSSRDGHFEIMVSPTIDEPIRVAGILVHELVHVVVGIECGHKGPFRKVAQKIGLEGPMTATTEGEAFKRAVAPLLEKLGPYPHAELIAGLTSGPKKQTARLIKCACPGVMPDGVPCPYTAWTPRRSLDIGPPLCPKHGEMVEKPPRDRGASEPRLRADVAR